MNCFKSPRRSRDRKLGQNTYTDRGSDNEDFSWKKKVLLGTCDVSKFSQIGSSFWWHLSIFDRGTNIRLQSRHSVHFKYLQKLDFVQHDHNGTTVLIIETIQPLKCTCGKIFEGNTFTSCEYCDDFSLVQRIQMFFKTEHITIAESSDKFNTIRRLPLVTLYTSNIQ